MAHGRLYTLKNGDWVQSSLKVDMKGCDFFQIYCKRYLNSLLQHFPDPICPLPVGEYLINNTLSSETFPSYLSSGLSKVDLLLEKDGRIIGGFKAVFNLIEKNI